MNKTKSVGEKSPRTSVGTRVQSQSTKRIMPLSELVLVGVGGIIGAGYFLGSGSPIRTAGPSVLLAFLLGAFITVQTTGALNTLALDKPSEGAFKVYADDYLGRFTGYMQGWSYYMTSILTISSEAVASAIFVRVWLPNVPLWIMSASFAALVVLINAFGIKNFGMVESVMSVIKIAALIGFIVVAALILFGWSPHAAASPRSLHSLYSQGFFPHGINGLFQSMLIVIFAYAGIGVFATASVELKNPKHLDIGGLTTVGLLTGLYLLSIGGVLLMLPSQSVSTKISPFVQALQHLRLGILSDILNAVILIASFSVMAGAVFSANQILVSLGHGGEAPLFTTKKSQKRATPYGALIATAIGLAIFIGMSYALPSTIYNLLISASSFFTFFNWFIMLLSFLAWRRKNAGKPISFLAFGQPFLTWVTMALIVVLTVYALFQREQRLGFYACVAMTVLFIVGYFFSRKRKDTPNKAVGD